MSAVVRTPGATPDPKAAGLPTRAGLRPPGLQRTACPGLKIAPICQAPPHPMLHYATVPVTPFEQNCSLVWCDQTMQGAVIDPGAIWTITPPPRSGG